MVIRIKTDSEKVNAKTKMTRANLVTGSRKTMAMMRGVSSELASCTATSNAEETKTMNVNIDAAIVPSKASADFRVQSGFPSHGLLDPVKKAHRSHGGGHA